MELGQVVSKLQAFCPPNLAEAIDNVGVLIEPSRPHNVRSIFVTTDITEGILDKAVASKCDMIVTYHPLLFTPFKRLTQSHWRERCVVKCLENKIAVYSPHTCLDSKFDGINDHLLSAFSLSKKVSVTPPAFIADDIYESTAAFTDEFKKFSLALPIAPMAVDIKNDQGRVAKFKYPKNQKSNIENEAGKHGVKLLTTNVINRPDPMSQGAGRVGYLQSKMTIGDIVNTYKKFLDLKSINVAIGEGKKTQDTVSTVAVCAGSGGGLLTVQPPALLADIVITGETSYQEQVEATSRGCTVIVLGHTAVERHFMQHKMLPFMQKELAGVKSELAPNDATSSQFM